MNTDPTFREKIWKIDAMSDGKADAIQNLLKDHTYNEIIVAFCNTNSAMDVYNLLCQLAEEDIEIINNVHEMILFDEDVLNSHIKFNCPKIDLINEILNSDLEIKSMVSEQLSELSGALWQLPKINGVEDKFADIALSIRPSFACARLLLGNSVAVEDLMDKYNDTYLLPFKNI